MRQIQIPDNVQAISPAETLQRYRLQISAMTSKAIDAANEKYPGFEQQLLSLVKKIEELEREQL
jgi:hypothetical protein